MNPYLKFGTKTAYEFVYERPRLRDQKILDCEPVQIWMLARHGTRYPGRKSIRELSQLQHLKVEIIRNHEELKNGRLCYADINTLKSWSFNVKMSDANLLTKQGYSDLYFLAKRLKTKYQSFFQKGYSPNLFRFRHTDSERTRQSAQAFAEGLFEPNQGVWIPPAVVNDTIIKPYENCTHWIKQVKDNPMNQKETELFKLTEDMQTLVHNVSSRLGFLYDLSVDTIETIYDMCRFDKSWNLNDRSPWCAAFTRSELRTLEYLEDIQAYYDSGYGDDLNLRLGCTTVKDMLEGFRHFPDQEPMGKFYFSHASVLLMTLARLGIANHGIPLRHDNFQEQKNRDWKTSELSPFAANLIAVFYKQVLELCFDTFMFFVNERRIDYEGCDVGLCSWSYIRDKFDDVFESCNLEWCKSRGGSFIYFQNSIFYWILCQIIILVFKSSVKIFNS
ncbi:multiple inositol polyphosphate phosphatase 1 precursor, putative [Pediculus humanus corporis]|uniref:Multiple inositol polyphosphate phosphatase 1 n=1 Tax=Pediculus humanus subsp. corporis TaxID=121224 RepID=E0VT88_PEDHC|nr:multiple inositol polyphosphate phosphatase 1 precursor, putative [Pediculus humanus corporis]EEB16594.1 multiple inositol polyphosphate phosphatase 1 precursor, putative [Pediculus humanus corporis]